MKPQPMSTAEFLRSLDALESGQAGVRFDAGNADDQRDLEWAGRLMALRERPAPPEPAPWETAGAISDFAGAAGYLNLHSQSLRQDQPSQVQDLTSNHNQVAAGTLSRGAATTRGPSRTPRVALAPTRREASEAPVRRVTERLEAQVLALIVVALLIVWSRASGTMRLNEDPIPAPIMAEPTRTAGPTVSPARTMQNQPPTPRPTAAKTNDSASAQLAAPYPGPPSETPLASATFPVPDPTVEPTDAPEVPPTLDPYPGPGVTETVEPRVTRVGPPAVPTPSPTEPLPTPPPVPTPTARTPPPTPTANPTGAAPTATEAAPPTESPVPTSVPTVAGSVPRGDSGVPSDRASRHARIVTTPRWRSL